MPTRSCLLSTLLLALAGLAGCSGGSSMPDNVIVYGRGEDANTLDPINTEIGEAVKVIHNIYDTLITYDDKTLDLQPALATSLGEVSEDGLVWTFPLRKDVKFHDGSTVDAEAVVFSIERLIVDDHRYARLARYLGPFLHWSGAVSDEVSKRVDAAER
ncbi:MAG: ABC transporter substrate-binding protein, partial [bacterium]|nr:ABC transporter substrate-binding protein [bacterium]